MSEPTRETPNFDLPEIPEVPLLVNVWSKIRFLKKQISYLEPVYMNFFMKSRDRRKKKHFCEMYICTRFETQK